MAPATRLVHCGSFLVLSLLLASPLAAQFTGTWSGTYQDQWNCAGGSFTSTGPLLLELVQSGNRVTGTATIDFYADDCRMLPSTRTVTGPVEGTVSGRTFNGSILGHGAVSAAILTLSADDGTLAVQYKISQSNPPVYFLTAHLTRLAAPGAQFNGTWSGIYENRWNCAGVGGSNFTSTGPMQLVLIQSGDRVTGTATIEFSVRDCKVVPAYTLSGLVEGTVSGRTFNGIMLGRGPERAAILTLSVDDATLGVQFVISQSNPSVYFLTANLIRGPFPTTGAVTGTWSGTANVTSRCTNGGVWSGSAPFALALMEQNGHVSGVVTFENEFLDQHCGLQSRQTFRLPLTGTLFGHTLTATVPDPLGEVAEVDPEMAISATVSGPAMSLAFTTGNESLGVTGVVALTRTGTTTPDSRFAGSWNGSYTMNQGPEEHCPGLPTYSGPMSATFFHAGTEISGFMTLLGTKTNEDRGDVLNCVLVEHRDIVVFLSGSVSANTAAGPGVIVGSNTGVGDHISNPITLTLSGDTIAGTEGDGQDRPLPSSATFSLSRSSTTLPPVIMRFETGPPSVRPGQSSTLRWQTFNAASVTIDNGLGFQDTSGSVTIAPLVTTTYTLTAAVSGGTVTAKTTVTVSGGVSRRRAARH